MTELTPEMTALVSAASRLPPELVRQVADFAEFLGKKQPAPAESGEEDDLRAVALASLRSFEAAHPDDNWGTNYTIINSSPARNADGATPRRGGTTLPGATPRVHG